MWVSYDHILYGLSWEGDRDLYKQINKQKNPVALSPVITATSEKQFNLFEV